MGHDTLSANQALGFRGDEREYSQCASMLADLQISRVELLTNNPQKAAALEKAGIIVEKRVEMMPKTWALEGHIVQDRDAYLVTKIKRMGHQLSVPSLIERQVTNSES